jgi:hypothetical protein
MSVNLQEELKKWRASGGKRKYLKSDVLKAINIFCTDCGDGRAQKHPSVTLPIAQIWTFDPLPIPTYRSTLKSKFEQDETYISHV